MACASHGLAYACGAPKRRVTWKHCLSHAAAIVQELIVNPAEDAELLREIVMGTGDIHLPKHVFAEKSVFLPVLSINQATQIVLLK